MASVRSSLIAAIITVGGAAGAPASAVQPTEGALALEALETRHVEPLEITAEERARLSALDVPALLDALDLQEVSYINAETSAGLHTNDDHLPVVLTRESGRVRILDVLTVSDFAPGDNVVARALQHGWTVTAINGDPITPPVADEWIGHVRMAADARPALLTVVTASGESREVSLSPVRRLAAPVATTRIGAVLYLRLFTLDEIAVSQVRDALQSAEPWLEGVILDLRANSGGLLDASVSIAGMFLDGGPVMAAQSRNGIGPFEQAGLGDLAGGAPVGILVDAGTAQGASLIAAALQDRGRARVLGMPTDKGGTVRTIVPLRHGLLGVLAIPTALIVRPNGALIEGSGVSPDVIVSLDEPAPGFPPGADTSLTGVERTAGEDAQLSWALHLLTEQ